MDNNQQPGAPIAGLAAEAPPTALQQRVAAEIAQIEPLFDRDEDYMVATYIVQEAAEQDADYGLVATVVAELATGTVSPPVELFKAEVDDLVDVSLIVELLLQNDCNVGQALHQYRHGNEN